MKKEDLIERLRALAEEAKSSSDDEVSATAGMLYCILGTLTVGGPFTFCLMNVVDDFNKELLAIIQSTQAIQSASRR